MPASSDPGQDSRIRTAHECGRIFRAPTAPPGRAVHRPALLNDSGRPVRNHLDQAARFSRAWTSGPDTPGRRSGGWSSGAAPDFNPFHSPDPECFRERRCGGPGSQHVVDNRDRSHRARPTMNGECTRNVGESFRRASGSRLRRRVSPDDPDHPWPRQPEVAPHDGRQLVGVVESAGKEASSGKRQPDHRIGDDRPGANGELSCKEPPERRRRRQVPRVLHPIDETAQRRREAPGCDHPIERRRPVDAGGAESRCMPTRCKGARGNGAGRSRAAWTRRADEQRLERTLAIVARIARRTDLAAQAAHSREEPVHQVAEQAVILQSLQHLASFRNAARVCLQPRRGRMPTRTPADRSHSSRQPVRRRRNSFHSPHRRIILMERGEKTGTGERRGYTCP